MMIGDLVEYNCDRGRGIGIILGEGEWWGQYIVALKNGEKIILAGCFLCRINQ